MDTLKVEIVDHADLTPRECEVLALLCEGSVDKVIARRLAISVFTAKCHIENIYIKLGVREASINAWCAALASSVARGLVKISSTALCVCLMMSFLSPDRQFMRPVSARPVMSRIRLRDRSA